MIIVIMIIIIMIIIIMIIIYMLIEALLILHIELKCFDHHLAQSSSNPLNSPCNASASLVFFLDRYQFVIPVPFC